VTLRSPPLRPLSLLTSRAQRRMPPQKLLCAPGKQQIMCTQSVYALLACLVVQGYLLPKITARLWPLQQGHKSEQTQKACVEKTSPKCSMDWCFVGLVGSKHLQCTCSRSQLELYIFIHVQHAHVCCKSRSHSYMWHLLTFAVRVIHI